MFYCPFTDKNRTVWETLKKYSPVHSKNKKNRHTSEAKAMRSLPDYLLYFFLYSFIGWITETVYCAFMDKKFTKRGFLQGPVCPIYGAGATAFILTLYPLYEKYAYSNICMIFLVIILGMLIADTVEFITSVIMEKFFNARWWDYSDRKFNLHGRICLRHTIYWGVATGIFIYIIHPAVTSFINRYLTVQMRNIILLPVIIIFAADIIFTIIKQIKQKQRDEKNEH